MLTDSLYRCKDLENQTKQKANDLFRAIESMAGL